MTATIAAETTSQIPIRLELFACGQDKPAFKKATRLTLDSATAKLCTTLGIPGSIKTDILQSPTEENAAIFKLWVNGRRVRYPQSLASWVHGYFDDELPQYDLTQEPLRTWLGRQDSEGVARFVSLTCVEALKRRPSILFSKNSAATYVKAVEQIAPELAGLDLEYTYHALRPVLDAWISIANVRAITGFIIKLHNGPAEELSQEIIAALSADTLEIRMPADYMREITTQATERNRDALSWLRDGIFEELGLTFPRFHFVPDDSLRQRSFAFQINDLLTMPKVAPPRGTVLVNETLEGSDPLKALVASAMRSAKEETNGAEQATFTRTYPVLNPATEQPGMLVSSTLAATVESLGLTTWDAIQYLTLCMADAFRTHAARFVTLSTIRKNLSLLKPMWPATIQAVRTELSDHQLTSILQQLAAEEVSLGDLPAIFERILDREYLVTKSSSVTVLDDYPVEVPWFSRTIKTDALTQFVRAGLRRRISAKLARDSTTVVVYLLDTAIEDMFLAAGSLEGLTEDDVDRVLKAFSAEVCHLPSTAPLPSVLTTAEIRPVVRSVVAQEYPRVAVIAHEEVSPEINVMPVARISLVS